MRLAFPLFLGIRTEDREIGSIKNPGADRARAFIRSHQRHGAVIINGEVNNVNKAINPYTGKVYDRSPRLLLAHPEPDRGVRVDADTPMVTFMCLCLRRWSCGLFWSCVPSGKDMQTASPSASFPQQDDVATQEAPFVKNRGKDPLLQKNLGTPCRSMLSAGWGWPLGARADP